MSDYTSSKINRTKAITISADLAATIKRFGIMPKDWRARVEEKHYLYQRAVEEILNEELKEVTYGYIDNGIESKFSRSIGT